MRPMSKKRERALRESSLYVVGSTFSRPRKGLKLVLPERPTKRHPLPKGPDALTVDRVLRRDGGLCVVCGLSVLDGVRGLDWSLHHRRGRDGKADSHKPQNLILVHGASNVDACHGRIHQSRVWARPLGYWLSRAIGADPLLAPVFVAGLDGFRYLAADGAYLEHPPLEVA